MSTCRASTAFGPAHSAILRAASSSRSAITTCAPKFSARSRTATRPIIPAPPITVIFMPLPPALDHDLLVGEEVHGVLRLPVQHPEERLLAAAEGEERHRRRQPDVDADHAGIDTTPEPARCLPALGVDDGGIAVATGIHHIHGLLHRASAQDGHD